jgi:tetratricopeptide (TPR) repeat protein
LFISRSFCQVLIHLKMLEAPELLNGVIAYSPDYATYRLKLARIYLNNSNLDEARTHYQKAIELLARSDKDYILMDEVRELRNKLELH